MKRSYDGDSRRSDLVSLIFSSEALRNAVVPVTRFMFCTCIMIENSMLNPNSKQSRIRVRLLRTDKCSQRSEINHFCKV